MLYLREGLDSALGILNIQWDYLVTVSAGCKLSIQTFSFVLFHSYRSLFPAFLTAETPSHTPTETWPGSEKNLVCYSWKFKVMYSMFPCPLFWPISFPLPSLQGQDITPKEWEKMQGLTELLLPAEPAPLGLRDQCFECSFCTCSASPNQAAFLGSHISALSKHPLGQSCRNRIATSPGCSAKGEGVLYLL